MSWSVIISVLGYVFGAGGILSFIVSMRTLHNASNKDAAEAWQSLYTAMEEKVAAQRSENDALRTTVDDLRLQVTTLRLELEGYKRFEKYVGDLEYYNSQLLDTVKPLVTQEAYKQLKARKPLRTTITHSEE